MPEYIPALVSLFGSFLGVLASQRLTQFRLERLEKKVDLHNNVIERTYKLEERVSVNEEKIRVANNRIADLERQAG